MTKTVCDCYHFNTTEISQHYADLLAIKVPFEAVLYQDDMRWFLEIVPKRRIHVEEFNNTCQQNNIETKRLISGDEARLLIQDFAHTKKSECLVPHSDVISGGE